MTLLYLFLFNLILGLEVIEDDSLLFESAEQVWNFSYVTFLTIFDVAC